MTPAQHERLVASAIILTRADVLATLPVASMRLLWPPLTLEEESKAHRAREAKRRDTPPAPAQQQTQPRKSRDISQRIRESRDRAINEAKARKQNTQQQQSKRATKKSSPPIQDAPPHNPEMEQGLLGSIMVSRGAAISQCRNAGVEAGWFFVRAHAIVFQEACDAYDANKPIELLAFTERLRAKKLLDTVGGAGFITHLFGVVPTADNVDYYIEILRDYHILRESMRAADNVARLARNLRPENEGNSPLPLLDEMASHAMSLRSLHGRNGQISFRSPSEILAMPRNLKANFLGDRLLGVARSLVLAGIGGLGKSRLLLQLLVAFILERIWCGIETHHTKGRPWMLVQTQNSTDRLQDDLEPLKKYAGDDWPLVEKNLLIHTLETDRDLMLHLSDPKNVRELQNAIRERDPIGAAFDPLNELAVGDLSKDTDMQATCNVLGHISRAGNPERAIIVATHALTGIAGMKKAFGFEAAGFGRNSKVLGFWTRAQINIIPGTEDHSVLVLTCGKLNDGKKFEPFAVRLNADTMIYEVDSDFDIAGLREQVESGKGDRTPPIEETLRKVLEQGRQYEKADIAKLVMNDKGFHKATAYRWVEKAVEMGVLHYVKKIDVYELT